MPISSVLGSSALLPAGLGFRNAIINGDFRINQRGLNSSGQVNGAALINGRYGQDRWLVYMADGTVTYSAQAFTLGNTIPGYEPTNFARIATSGQTLASAFSSLNQFIEGVRTFAGQQVTISFWAKAASGTPKVAVAWQQAFGSGGGSTAVNTAVSAVTISTSWTRYQITTTVPSISGKTIGTGNDDYLLINLITSAGSNNNTIASSIGIQNNTIDFWGIQVEQNYQPTSFEQRPLGIELILCQRYYQIIMSGFMEIGIGAAYTSTDVRVGRDLPVTMRVAPTASIVTGSGYWVIYANSAGRTDYSINTTFDVTSPYRVTIQFTGGTAFTTGSACLVRGNNASASIAANAEW